MSTVSVLLEKNAWHVHVQYCERISFYTVNCCHTLNTHALAFLKFLYGCFFSNKRHTDGRYYLSMGFFIGIWLIRKKISFTNAIVDEIMQVFAVMLRIRRHRWYKFCVKGIIVLWSLLFVFMCVSMFPNEELLETTTSTSLVRKSSQSKILRSMINFLVKTKTVLFTFPKNLDFWFWISMTSMNQCVNLSTKNSYLIWNLLMSAIRHLFKHS